MSVPYIPKITTGGQDAAITARENGFAFEVTHMSFGTGSYVMTGNETALANEVARVPIAGGGKIAGMLSLVINTILRDADLNVGVGQPVNITEIGFWNEGVLFAIYSVNTVLFTKHLGLDFAMTYSLALKTLMPIDAANITVVIDESASITLALIGQHLAGSNPHPQYATVIMLNAEVAARIAADSYTAERLQANGIDADLGTTNALTLNNLDGLIAVGEYYAHLLDNIPFSYVLAKVWRENENIVYQLVQGAGNTRIATRYGSRAVNTDPVSWQGWKYYASVAELDSEITARTNGDLSLAIALASEITNRGIGDTNEANARIAGDNYLLSLINVGNTETSISSNTQSGSISNTVTLPNGCKSVFIAMNAAGGRAGCTPNNGGQGGGGGGSSYLRVLLKGDLSGYIIDFHLEAINGNAAIAGYNTFGTSASDNAESWMKIWNPNIANYAAIFYLGSGQNAGNGHGEHDGGGISYGGPKGLGGKARYRIAANPNELYDVFTLDGTDGTDGVFNVGQHDSSLTGHGGVQELGGDVYSITNPSAFGNGGTAGSSNTVGYQGGYGFILVKHSVGL